MLKDGPAADDAAHDRRRTRSSNGVFLHCDYEVGGIQHPRRVGIDHDDVGWGAGAQRSARQARSSAGRVDIARISVVKSISPLWTSRSAAGSTGLSPIAPEALPRTAGA